MKLNRLFIYSSLLALSIAGCKKDHKDLGPTNNNGGTDTTKHQNPPPPPEPYTITEDFETGSKTGYDAGDVTTATGSWNLDGALLGSDPSDTKDGNKSVRIQGTTGNTKRNGIVTMDFDIKHLTSISIKSALTNFADKARPAKNVNPPYLKGTWELQESKDGGKNFVKIGNTVTCDTLLTATVFPITDTVPVRFRIVNTSDLNGSNKVRINIDDIVFSGIGDPGVTVGDGGDPDTTATSTPAGARNVTVDTDAPPPSGDNSNLLMGNPSNAQTSLAMGDNYLIDQGYYVESYSASRGEPNWVSWHLDASNTTGATGRLDNFAAWAGLPTSFYEVQSNSYSGSGFDRGHNCPSADRTSSVNANSATFLMTNMIPQAPENNQQTWNNMESDLRALIGQGNELYIIMGSYGSGGTGSKGAATTINNGKVAVPAHVWKIAIVLPVGNGDINRITADTRVIAVDTPNDNSIDHDWTKYTTTIQAIETATGYSLLSALPGNVRAALEVKTSGI
jgi:endonuclease G